MENGSADAGIESRDAKSIMANLLRQAWEKHCAREGFLAHTFSSGFSFHVGEDKLGLKKRVSWGRQGERRNSMRAASLGRRSGNTALASFRAFFPIRTCA
jgi:hypothetical protein